MESKNSFVVNSMGILNEWNIELTGNKEATLLGIYGEEECLELTMEYHELCSLIEHLEEAKRVMSYLGESYCVLDRDIKTIGGRLHKEGTVVNIVSGDNFTVELEVEATRERLITGADCIRTVMGAIC